MTIGSPTAYLLWAVLACLVGISDSDRFCGPWDLALRSNDAPCRIFAVLWFSHLSSLELWQVSMSPMECRSTAWGFQTGHDSECLVIPFRPIFYANCQQYTYVASMPLLVVFSVAMSVLKYKEGMLSIVNVVSTEFWASFQGFARVPSGHSTFCLVFVVLKMIDVLISHPKTYTVLEG